MHLPSGYYPKLGFKVESPTHGLLGFVKAMRGKADVDMALDVVAGKFDDKSKVSRSADVLLKNGYITVNNDGNWAITDEGNNALIVATSANIYKGKRGSGNKHGYSRKGKSF